MYMEKFKKNSNTSDLCEEGRTKRSQCNEPQTQTHIPVCQKNKPYFG